MSGSHPPYKSPTQSMKSSKSHFDSSKRLRLRDIARETIEAINNDYVIFGDVAQKRLRQSSDETAHSTMYFRPGSARLRWWQQGPPLAVTAYRHGRQSEVAVQIMKMSTLQGAHFLYKEYPTAKIGVLNFASATQPGGGFINGASAQEESIARSSTLYLSLQTLQARQFYALHDKDNQGGYYSHAMIYSPSIAIFRDDDGKWLQPYYVSVVTSPAVNAGLVRKLRYRSRVETENEILSVMRERMGRILAVFELEGIRHLVLGSFGTGVFQNEVGALARIWGELLSAPGARFAHSFDTVVFAIPDNYTRQKFSTGFRAAVDPPRKIWLWRGML